VFTLRTALLSTLFISLLAFAGLMGLSAFKPVLPDMLDHTQTTLKQQAQAYSAYAKGPTRLFALGDTGSGNANQKAVASAMYRQQMSYVPKEAKAACASKESCQTPGGICAVLHMGDVIYPSGEATVNGDRLFSDIYAPLTKMGIPFYLTLGNHDMKTSDGQEVMAKFNVPDQGYYFKQMGLVDVFAINTSSFNMTQQLWLKQALMSSKAKWKIVYGHHPLYSTGAHGYDADIVQLRSALEPILINYNADVYLAGHDHNYERFGYANQDDSSKTLPYLHIVSGGGGAFLRNTRKMPAANASFPSTAHYAIKYHYLDLSIEAQKLTIQARDINNAIFDSATLTK